MLVTAAEPAPETNIRPETPRPSHRRRMFPSSGSGLPILRTEALSSLQPYMLWWPIRSGVPAVGPRSQSAGRVPPTAGNVTSCRRRPSIRPAEGPNG
jgi:hypothetical protein